MYIKKDYMLLNDLNLSIITLVQILELIMISMKLHFKKIKIK